MTQQTQKTALFSVSDRTGLVDFARILMGNGWKFLGSKGTAAYLNENGVPTTDIARFVGEPILGHRVVTLSREIHAALLATNSPEDQAELAKLGVPRIDLAYVNFYSLPDRKINPDFTLESVIEKTDIGGPTMLRSAAKGRRLALCKPSQFNIALDYIDGKYDATDMKRIVSALASVVEYEVERYCRVSADYQREMAGNDFFQKLS